MHDYDFAPDLGLLSSRYSQSRANPLRLDLAQQLSVRNALRLEPMRLKPAHRNLGLDITGSVGLLRSQAVVRCAEHGKKPLVVAVMDREGLFVLYLEPRPSRASRAVGADELTLVTCSLKNSGAHGRGDMSRNRRLPGLNLARARFTFCDL